MNIIDRITSGNWYVKEVQRAGKDYYVLRELNDIAFLNHYNGLPETEQKANALAISKVPEMLELIGSTSPRRYTPSACCAGGWGRGSPPAGTWSRCRTARRCGSPAWWCAASGRRRPRGCCSCCWRTNSG